MFNIYLPSETAPESDEQAVYGKIEIEDFAETFVTSLVTWSREDYESQWYRACQRLVEGATESALVASYVDPSMSEFFMWWPLYREGEIVHVRNELVPYSQLTKPFTPNEPWALLKKREIMTDEGLEISEWNTTVEHIQQFLVGLEKSRS